MTRRIYGYHPFTCWMEATFLYAAKKLPSHRFCPCYALSLNRSYPGRVCVVLTDRFGWDWITHILVYRRGDTIVVEGQWSGVSEMDDYDDHLRHDKLLKDIKKRTRRCLHDVFGKLHILRIPHAPAEFGFYQTHNDGSHFDESFEYNQVECGTDDWKERHIWIRFQRMFLRRRELNQRLKREVFDAWFEMGLRPGGATAQRIVRDLSVTGHS